MTVFIMVKISSKPAMTKHARLAASLRRRIVRGELKPGDQLPSFSQLREQHGITLSTIEKVLTTLERDGLIERFHGKGVFVAQKRPATKCLGFLSGKQGTSAWGLYWVQFMDGLQAGAHAAGYEILLLNPAQPTAWHGKVDGVIFHEMTLEDCVQMRLSAAQVNVISAVSGMTSVVADEFGGAHQAVQHLLESGHRRIAYLVDDSFWQTQLRLTGYRAALREAGVKAAPNWVRLFEVRSDGKTWAQSGKTEMNAWLQSDWKKLGCTALLCHNDEVAMGVMEALLESGLRIPEDVSVIGYDGTILCETSQPRLTSIKVPLREIGLRAAMMLIEQIETGQSDAVTLSLPTTLQLRGSTRRRTESTS